MDAQWDCFVAYPTARRATAEQLADLLARRVRVFLDVRAVQPGDNWSQTIPAALEGACVTVVLVAPETERAFYEQEEIAHAVDRARRDEASHRVVPVFLGDATPKDRVPYGLRTKQGFVVTSPADLARAADGIATLVEEITHRIELEADGEEPRQVSPAIREHLATLQIEVEQLTRDQYRIINQLRFMRRVRISGCAGSGKTLVAAEKATRLAKGGAHVLFLCHNPLLAEHVQQLTAGSGVEVRDFARWTAELAGEPALLGEGEWTHYDEPIQSTLDRAFDQLARGVGQVDAIVVDEGQDFRDEWWGVVEAGLADASHGWLYIFHDNNQSLLAQRGRYPIAEPHVDLSRNCRNAGRVLDLMRCFDSSAPEPELGLRQRGSVRIKRLAAGQDALAETLGYLEKQLLLEDTVVLTTDEAPVAGSPLAGCEVTLPATAQWQIEVRRQFDRVLHYYERRGMRPPPGGEAWIVAQLAQLSLGPYPTDHDVERVRDVARQFSIDREARGWVGENPLLRNTISFRDDGQGPRLRRRAKHPFRAAEVVLYFEREDWPRGLPRPTSVVLQPFYLPRAAGILPLYRVSDFKGLEAEAVVLVMRGRVSNHREATYVGVSRARALLCIIADEIAAAVLPKSFSWDQG
jgi:hypothetical protein